MEKVEELHGLDWLASPVNRRWERRTVQRMLPLLLGAQILAKTAVLVVDQQCPTTRHEPRSLVPGTVYNIEKIGIPGRPVSDALNRYMLDELPQLLAVRRGELALVGPRGTEPGHREALFDSISDGKTVDNWRTILNLQRPGLLSTYAISLHGDSSQNQSHQLTAAHLEAEALQRYEADKLDFEDASYRHSRDLVSQFRLLVANKVRGIIHGSDH